MIIGILSLQGSFIEHYQSLVNLMKLRDDFEVQLVKTKDDLNLIDGLVIPGGESTTLKKLINDLGLYQTLLKRIKSGMPVYGTCAGLIILAKTVDNKEGYLNAIDIKVKRNAYGRQNSSFVTYQNIHEFDNDNLEMVFIRGPYIEEAGSDVKIITTYNNEIVCCRNSNILVSSFHPEFTNDLSVHNYFVNMVKESIYK